MACRDRTGAFGGTVDPVTEPAPETPTMRIGNAEREEAAQLLAEHFSHGRLDGAEYEERVAAVWTARTTADVGPLFADLPEPHPRMSRVQTPPTGSAMGSPATAYGPPAGLTSAPPSYGAPPTYGAAGLPVPGYAHAPLPFPGTDPAPYGREPGTGAPYSDKSKVAAGVLQLFLGGAGIGRFYTGHTGIAIAQLIVTILTLGFGALWGFVDGIVILASRSTDSSGRPLRP